MVSGVSTLAYSLEMDWALLWLTAKFLDHRTTYLRLTLAAAAGTLPTLWVLLQQNLYAVPWELGLLWPGVMLGLAFPNLPRRFWVRSYVLFIALCLMIGGALILALNWFSEGPVLDWAFVVPLALVAVGLWIPKARIRQLLGRDLYGEVRLEVAGQQRTFAVFWDSGNQLTEPTRRRPVVIIDRQAVWDWLPCPLLEWVSAVHAQEHGVQPPAEWRGRVGVVRFRTISGEGSLPVVAVDHALGRWNEKWYAMTPVMMGIAWDSVAADKSYVALATPRSLIHWPHERVGA
ncbi:MAG: sporulation protein [Sulfobacillus acidophilus]|uniref:Sporulation protein n=1 Tax=Sulfobacillus acidophilus TaxID=53633 RepID=A0A2T2WEJ2_9FIRM|nr:MAG: sporulation protein [Sulfobacillus acidophilus]